ncbi:uncharacterized protein LOC109819395, partial [Asparagus officinalis]|uniref:uncharacterized protein LOC109819395 n=1 Tax=Asparagus officinalis TaxID=4686 RepID=UPI00098E0D0B
FAAPPSADAFTGRELRSPKFPSGDFNFLFGILTAPISSESCSLLVVALNISSDLYSILCWSPGSKRWVELNLVGSPEVMSLVVFKGQVFGMDSLYRVLVIDLAPRMSWRLLDAKLSTGTFLYNYYGKFGQNLVECNGELFVVLLIPTGKFSLPGSPKIEVYSLDFSESVWVKKESLGDWCLFMDAVGKCSFACRDPGRWGGRKNCVYVAGPGYAGWSVFPLDGEAIDTSEESPLKSWYVTLPRWPSPVWVYPSMLL